MMTKEVATLVRTRIKMLRRQRRELYAEYLKQRKWFDERIKQESATLPKKAKKPKEKSNWLAGWSKVIRES